MRRVVHGPRIVWFRFAGQWYVRVVEHHAVGDYGADDDYSDDDDDGARHHSRSDYDSSDYRADDHDSDDH